MAENQISKIRVQYQPWAGRFGIYIMGESREISPKRLIGVNLELVEYDESAIQKPTISASDEMAQQLMDDLWNAGIRPSTRISSQLDDGTKAHLEDMRRLVFEVTVPNILSRR